MEINHFMIRWQHEENYPSTNVGKPPGRENDPGQEQEHEDTSQRQTAHIQAALCVGRTNISHSISRFLPHAEESVLNRGQTRCVRKLLSVLKSRVVTE